MNIMRYEEGTASTLRPLSVKKSLNITKMSSGAILWHLYKRHEIFLLYVAVAVIMTWAFVTKLG